MIKYAEKKNVWVISVEIFFRKYFCLIQLPKTKRPKVRKRTISAIGKGLLSHLALLCVEHAYVNSVDVEKLLTTFHQKKFVPGSSSNQCLCQTTPVIYFESFTESKLVNSVLSKRNLGLKYMQKTSTWIIFWAHNKRLPQVPPDEF